MFIAYPPVRCWHAPACGGGVGGGSVSENQAAVVSSRPSRAPLGEVIRASLSVAEGTDGATEDFLERPW